MPYIYYYFDRYEAFVIGRADGTDSHLLGEGLFTLNKDASTIQIDDHSWSPSGQWLAWVDEQLYPRRYTYTNRGYVLNIDNERHLDVLERFNGVRMEWSPVEDLLLVAGRYAEQLEKSPKSELDCVDKINELSIMLLNPQTNQVLSSFVEERPASQTLYTDDYCLFNFDIRLSWTPDGNHAIAIENEYVDQNIEHFTVYVFDKLGNISIQEYQNLIFAISLIHQRFGHQTAKI